MSQCGVYATFVLYLLWAWRRGVNEWAPLLGACAYAVLFEHWNMLRYAHAQGGYHYHSASWLWVWGDVPLYIPLAWAFILATSRALTDHLRLRPWARPFADALLALLIDVSMDAVAIRLKFWTWHGVGWNDAFFGVPADNFVGWLLVSFTFSTLTRWLWSGRSTVTGSGSSANVDSSSNVRSRHRADGGTAAAFVRSPSRPKRLQWNGLAKTTLRVVAQILLIPPAAYTAYLGLEAIVHLQYTVFHAQTLRGQLYVLAGTVLAFGAVIAAGARRRRGPATGEYPHGAYGPARAHTVIVHGPRHIFHLFGLLGLLCVPAALRAPALWALAGGVWAVEWTIALCAARCARRDLERTG